MMDSCELRRGEGAPCSPQSAAPASLPIRAWAVSLLCLLFLPGCSLGYLARAGWEEARILWRRQPIERLLEKPDLDPRVRRQLELALDVRSFAARSLGLRVGGSYATLSRVDAGQVVHSVSAAERFALQPYLWWFPLVGRVPYKGFFDPDDARAEARRLDAAGYDVLVRPVAAFSTLGWFNDPLLSHMLEYDAESLAETILHELLHNTIYLPGQADFNESFATFVGYCGAAQFFAERGSRAEEARARDRWADALTFSGVLHGFVDRLHQAYREPMTLERRAGLFRQLRDEFNRTPFRTDRFRRFGDEELDNAKLLQERAYATDLTGFDEALRERSNDLARTISELSAAALACSGPAFSVLTAAPPGAGQSADPTARPSPSGLETVHTAQTDADR